MKARIIPLGAGSIAITSDDFFNGFQTGQLAYQSERNLVSYSDRHVTSLLMEQLEDVDHPELYNFGFLVGWFAELANTGQGLEERQEGRP